MSSDHIRGKPNHYRITFADENGKRHIATVSGPDKATAKRMFLKKYGMKK